jgi:magnesium transporter
MNDHTTPEGFAPLALASQYQNGHVADIVEALNALTPEQATAIIAALPQPRAFEIMDQPDLDHVADIIETLPVHKAAELLAGMSADRAAAAMRDCNEDDRARLFASLDTETKAALHRLLAYPETSAGGIMTTEFVSVPATWTVSETLAFLRAVERTRETIYAIYVLEPDSQELLRAVTLRRLLRADPEAKIGDAAHQDEPVTVTALTDREDVARIIQKYDLLAVPVVDSARHILGIVTVDDIIDTMFAVTTEDMQKYGGVEALDNPYMSIGFFGMLRKRAGWLSILFMGEMLTASAMQHFAHELDKAIVLTLFIPLIMSSGGNSGSQATSLLIRALALNEVRLKDWWRVVLREMPTGLALGTILGAIGILRISVWQTAGIFDYGPHWELVAITVGCALIAIVMFGSVSGAMLPFILKRLGFDPASASAPFVATLVDVSGLVIYFTVAAMILRGTLL